LSTEIEVDRQNGVVPWADISALQAVRIAYRDSAFFELLELLELGVQLTCTQPLNSQTASQPPYSFSSNPSEDALVFRSPASPPTTIHNLASTNGDGLSGRNNCALLQSASMVPVPVRE
jgi:hypothetical protein